MRHESRQSTAGSELDQLRAQLDQWRRRRKRGARVPKELWDSAVRLSEKHSVSEISRTLRLDYQRLRRRVEALREETKAQDLVTPTFVEIASARAQNPEAECIVEFENPRGVKVRMYFHRKGDLDFAALSNAFWRNGG